MTRNAKSMGKSKKDEMRSTRQPKGMIRTQKATPPRLDNRRRPPGWLRKHWKLTVSGLTIVAGMVAFLANWATIMEPFGGDYPAALRALVELDAHLQNTAEKATDPVTRDNIAKQREEVQRKIWRYFDKLRLRSDWDQVREYLFEVPEVASFLRGWEAEHPVAGSIGDEPTAEHGEQRTAPGGSMVVRVPNEDTHSGSRSDDDRGRNGPNNPNTGNPNTDDPRLPDRDAPPTIAVQGAAEGPHTPDGSSTSSDLAGTWTSGGALQFVLETQARRNESRNRTASRHRELLTELRRVFPAD